MKTNRIISILFLVAMAISAYALVPKTETTTRWMRVTDVERTDSALRVGIRLQNYPRFWVQVSPSIRLMATSDTTLQYKIIATENIELDQKIWMPESGYHEGVLLFEKVPADVKIVDLVETDPSDAGSCIYGIHLDEQATPVSPNILTLSDILDNRKRSEDEWTGLDPKRYADMNFYDKDGIVRIQGKITDYSTKYGVSTFSVNTKNDFTHEEKVSVGDINPDGTFALDIPLAYPQFDYFKLGDISKNLFLIPGDTLEITTCMAMKIDPDYGHSPEFFGYEGVADDGVVINMLTDSIYKRYGIKSMYGKYRAEDTDSMKAETYKISERLAALLDSVRDDLPKFLGSVPVSVFAKDLLSIAAIGQICSTLEDVQMNFNYAKGPRLEKDDDGKMGFTQGESLDETIFLKPWMKHKDLIYDNPILVCHGWVLPNRWRFNNQFHPSAMAASGMEAVLETLAYTSCDDPKSTYEIDLNRLDSIGLGNCFVAQLVRTVSLIDGLHSTSDLSSGLLGKNNRLVTYLIRHNEYDGLNEILMSEYNNFVKDVMISENQLADNKDTSIIITDSPEGNVLAKIIEPYKGNVLFLDFWGIGCGPCRAGMMSQKSLLEELADKPFKALYIANAEEGMDACKKWLRKEEIKGEHIFVSGDDWERLRGLFNFSAIPFGVLINKDGNIVKTHYSIYEDEPLLKETLSIK